MNTTQRSAVRLIQGAAGLILVTAALAPGSSEGAVPWSASAIVNSCPIEPGRLAVAAPPGGRLGEPSLAVPACLGTPVAQDCPARWRDGLREHKRDLLVIFTHPGDPAH